MFKKRLSSFVLIQLIILSISSFFFTNAYSTNINQQKKEKQEIEDKKKQEEEKLASLKKKQAEISKAIEELDNKKEEIERNITEKNNKIENTKKKISKLNLELKIAKKVEEEQYDIMKKRIKYIYENGNMEYLDIFLGASSIEEVLNKAEYTAKISRYDNNLLEKYIAAKNYVNEKKVEKEEKLAELNIDLGELEIKKAENERLAASKNEQIKNFNKLIDEAGRKVAKYKLDIVEKEKYIDRLIRQAAEEKKLRELRNNTASGKVSASGMLWPLPVSKYITSGFGYRGVVMKGSGTFHRGIDIAANTGATIVAAKDGQVISSGYNLSMGNYVLLYHGGDLYTVYMHASKLLVSTGMTVSRGTPIAQVGSTGMSTGPHLHFGVKIGGEYVNPLKYVSPN